MARRYPTETRRVWSLRIPSVIVKYLISVLQNGIDDSDLPSSVRDVGARIRAHERGAECTVSH